MVRPSKERQTIPLTIAQSDLAGDGTESGEDVDIDAGGTVSGGGGGIPTPPNPELLEVVEDTDSGGVIVDMSEATWWDITLTADTILVITNPPPTNSVGQLHIILRQGAGAPWLVTWPAEVQWADTDGTTGGAAPTLWTVVTAANVFHLTTEDGGTTWDGGDPDGSGNSNDTSYVEVAATGATETVDVSVARTYDLTLDANCTLTLSGAVNNEAWFLTLMLRQDGTGSRLVTWPGSVVWPGGTTPTLATAANSVDVFELFSVDGGTTWFGFPTGGASSSLTIKDEGVALATAATSLDFVGDGVVASGSGAAKTITIAAGSASSSAIDALGFVGAILISDTPSTPLVFADLIQNEAQDDLVYADPLP